MGKSHDLATLKDDGGTFSGSLNVTGSNFASTTYTGTSVNPTGVYTGLTSDGGFTNNVRDSGYLQLSTNNVERMRIDASGRVTMPYQPWALVDMGGGQNYIGEDGVIAFDNVVQSTGSHYNTSTYRFVCPVAGVYSISWSILSQNNSDAYHVEPRVNGTRFARAYVVYRANRGYIEYKCSANDYLDIQMDNFNVYPSTGTDRYTWACYRFLG